MLTLSELSALESVIYKVSSFNNENKHLWFTIRNQHDEHVKFSVSRWKEKEVRISIITCDMKEEEKQLMIDRVQTLISELPRYRLQAVTNNDFFDVHDSTIERLPANELNNLPF